MTDFSMSNVVLSPVLTALARRILLGYMTDDMDALRIVNEEIAVGERIAHAGQP